MFNMIQIRRGTCLGTQQVFILHVTKNIFSIVSDSNRKFLPRNEWFEWIFFVGACQGEFFFFFHSHIFFCFHSLLLIHSHHRRFFLSMVVQVFFSYTHTHSARSERTFIHIIQGMLFFGVVEYFSPVFIFPNDFHSINENAFWMNMSLIVFFRICEISEGKMIILKLKLYPEIFSI